MVGGSGDGDDREGRLRKEGIPEMSVGRPQGRVEGRTHGGTTPKGGMKE